jgi:ribosomal protein S18 acetylase RimI-like enzyme
MGQWHTSGDPAFGWVEVLGVGRPWRGRGLGLALLRHAFVEFAARGATRVGLGVDAENTTGAVRLYERAGMQPVRRQDVYEKTP